jgi:hypothetical protein
MKLAFLAPLTLGLALGGPALQAGDRPLFGGAVHVNLPVSELKSDAHDRVGFGAAFHVAVDLGGGHLLRPRLDVDTYRVKGAYDSGSDHQATLDLSGVGLGVDYLHHFGGRADRGLYALAGLGVKRWSVDYGSYDRQGDTVTTASTDARRRTSLEAALGLGYQVKAWFGLEARYTHSRYEGTEGVRLYESTPNSPAASRDAGAFQVAATFRW